MKKYSYEEYRKINPESEVFNDNFADWKMVDKVGNYRILVHSSECRQYESGLPVDEVYIEHEDIAHILCDVCEEEVCDYVSSLSIDDVNTFADFINKHDDWLSIFNDVIERNGWEDLSGNEFDICKDSEGRRVTFDDNSVAIVI